MAVTKIRGNQQIINATVTAAQADGTIIKADGTSNFTADQSMNSHKLTNLLAPASANDAATKAYVDSVASGLDVKNSVRAASVANVSLTGTQTIDGVALIAGDRVLLKNQTTGTENGIYTVSASAWARSVDADTSAEVTSGMFTFVEEGTTQVGTGWVLSTPNPITLGTTALTFAQFSAGAAYVGGNGLTLTGNVFDVNVSTTGGIQITSDNLNIKLDGTSLSVGTNGLKVNPAKFIVRETPSGTIDGANTAFTLANTPIAGTEQVYLNGLLQEPGGGNDYTISAGTITYLTAPVSGDRLRVSYIIA
jgi:hypothetical protein